MDLKNWWLVEVAVANILLGLVFASVHGPLIFVVLVVVIAALMPYLRRNRFYVLSFFIAILIAELVIIFAFGNPTIAGGTVVSLVTLSCALAGFETLVIGALEIGAGTRRGQIINEEAHDRGVFTLTNGLIIFGFLFANYIVLGYVSMAL